MALIGYILLYAFH